MNCQYCNKSYSNKQNLVKHQKTESCISKQNIIKNLRLQLDDTKSQLDTAQSEIKVLRDEIIRLKTRLEVYSEQKEDDYNYQDELKSLREDNVKLKTRLEIYSEQKQDNTNTNTKLTTKIDNTIKMPYVYLIQCPYFKDDIFKIGGSEKIENNRLKSYGNGTKILAMIVVKDDYREVENQIKFSFNSKFTLVHGKEYFQGNKDEIKQEFLKIVYNHEISNTQKLTFDSKVENDTVVESKVENDTVVESKVENDTVVY